MTRRDFLHATATAAIALNLPSPPARTVRFGAITDVHHGLAPDSMRRLQAFVSAVNARADLDFVVQLGDFCHTWPLTEAKPFLKVWNSISLPKYHVLGNHDMDRGSKADAVKLWGMPARYYSFESGGWRFLVLDLNHFKKAGALHDYDRGNYFTSNASHNWADPAQLEWLADQLRRSSMPTVVFAHQPLGIPNPDGTLPLEQWEVLDIVKGKACAAVFGHLHVDRLEHVQTLPCFCLNSASYFWQQGMHPYRDPLFAFIELGSDGTMRVEGVVGEFLNGKPKTNAKGCSASIDDRSVRMRR